MKSLIFVFVCVAVISAWKLNSLNRNYSEYVEADVDKFSIIASEIRKGSAKYGSDQIAELMVLASDHKVASYFIKVLNYFCIAFLFIAFASFPFGYWLGQVKSKRNMTSG